MTDTDQGRDSATATLTFEEGHDIVTSDAHGLCDLDGRITFVDERCCALMRCSDAELLGRLWQDLIHAPDRPLFLAGFGRLLEGGPSYVATVRIASPDDRLTWTSIRAGVLRGPHGERSIHFSAWPGTDLTGPAFAGDDLLGLDAVQCAGYVRQMVSELSRLTRARNLDVLSEVLSIAASIAANDMLAPPSLSADDATLPTRQ